MPVHKISVLRNKYACICKHKKKVIEFVMWYKYFFLSFMKYYTSLKSHSIAA